MIVAALGFVLFFGALIAFAVNNINTRKNPKPVTPEEKKKRHDRNVAIGIAGAVGIGAMAIGNSQMERNNRQGQLGF